VSKVVTGRERVYTEVNSFRCECDYGKVKGNICP